MAMIIISQLNIIAWNIELTLLLGCIIVIMGVCVYVWLNIVDIASFHLLSALHERSLPFV